MHFIPVKTRVMVPPKDDLFDLLDTYLTDVKEKDLILITSKIVAIHQGRCIPLDAGKSKRELVEGEAEYFIEGAARFGLSPLAIKYGSLFYAAGIDESNANDHYILLPSDPFSFAQSVFEHVTKKHGVSEIGIVITDSHSAPLRRGSTNISIAFWGFHPVDHHQGKKDLFGRTMKFSVTNIADAVSAGSAAVSGETDEATPLCIVREVPNVVFTKHDTRHELLVSKDDDIYEPLLRPFYKNED